MDPLSLLANLLLSVTIGTLMVALIAYMAYKLREKRKPAPPAPVTDAKDAPLVFLQPYVPKKDAAPSRSIRPKQ